MGDDTLFIALVVKIQVPQKKIIVIHPIEKQANNVLLSSSYKALCVSKSLNNLVPGLELSRASFKRN